MTEPNTTTWTDRLRAIARPVLTQTPMIDSHIDPESWIAGFKDGRGNRRRLDPIFLSAMLTRPTDVAPGAQLDEQLWTAAANTDPTTADQLAATDGPLAQMGAGVIEVWTETELSAIQALACLARRTSRADLHERAYNAARWHLANTQPDNATNRPWALNVFVALAARSDEHANEAELYAQTLLHNAMMPAGTPDPLSACILWQAAHELEANPDPEAAA